LISPPKNHLLLAKVLMERVLNVGVFVKIPNVKQQVFSYCLQKVGEEIGLCMLRHKKRRVHANNNIHMEHYHGIGDDYVDIARYG